MADGKQEDTLDLQQHVSSPRPVERRAILRTAGMIGMAAALPFGMGAADAEIGVVNQTEIAQSNQAPIAKPSRPVRLASAA